MKESQKRWRRPGVRAAIIALIVLGIYFLAIFVKQSVTLYQLAREVRAEERVVEDLRAQNESLERRLAFYRSEEGLKWLVRKGLPYKSPGEKVLYPVGAGGTGQAGDVTEQSSEPPREDIASLPIWQQWWRVILTPSLPASP